MMGFFLIFKSFYKYTPSPSSSVYLLIILEYFLSIFFFIVFNIDLLLLLLLIFLHIQSRYLSFIMPLCQVDTCFCNSILPMRGNSEICVGCKHPIAVHLGDSEERPSGIVYILLND